VCINVPQIAFPTAIPMPPTNPKQSSWTTLVPKPYAAIADNDKIHPT
jgi:hypothetical protein